MLEKLDDLQQPLEQVLEEVMFFSEFKGALLENFSKLHLVRTQLLK
jgi:hypothetical protein